MDSAYYLPDGSTLGVLKLAEMITENPSIRSHYTGPAGNLACTDCDGLAWYISGSSSGTGPTFGGHHDDDCELASQRGHSAPGQLEPAAPELTNEFSSLALHYSALGQSDSENAVRAATAGEDAQGRTGRSHSAAIGHGSTHQRYMELRVMLRHLVQDPGWTADQGELRVNLPERPQALLRDVIWSMEDFDPDNAAMMNKQLIAWGKIGTVNPSNSGWTYFNQAPQAHNKGAIILGPDDCSNVVTQYAGRGITSAWDFKDWYIAAVGRSYRTSNGRVGLTAAMPYIAFYRPRRTT